MRSNSAPKQFLGRFMSYFFSFSLVLFMLGNLLSLKVSGATVEKVVTTDQCPQGYYFDGAVPACRQYTVTENSTTLNMSEYLTYSYRNDISAGSRFFDTSGNIVALYVESLSPLTYSVKKFEADGSISTLNLNPSPDLTSNGPATVRGNFFICKCDAVL